MYANQISVILNRDPVTRNLFHGVFSCDNIPQILYDKGFIIVNTAPSNHSGEHCVLLYKNKSKIFLFDSLAKYQSYYGKCFEKIINKILVDFDVLRNLYTVQSVYSNVCGLYCIYISISISRGKSINTILNKFTRNTNQNDLKIVKWFRKYIKQFFS